MNAMGLAGRCLSQYALKPAPLSHLVEFGRTCYHVSYHDLCHRTHSRSEFSHYSVGRRKTPSKNMSSKKAALEQAKRGL